MEEVKADRRGKLDENYHAELMRLEEELFSRKELVKFKPKHKLFELQVQEKLVSLEERVEEALDFRKELKEMEKMEAERVDIAIASNTAKAKNKLAVKFAREKKQLELVLEEMEHKLLIKMRN